MTYTIRIVQSDAEFQALGAEWDRLLLGAVGANTFMSHAWLEAWWSAYRPRANLRILLAERDGAVHGIAPMMLSREAGIGRIYRRLRFVGDGTFETDHMNFLVAADDRSRVLAALLEAIDSLPWDIAHFSQIQKSSEHTQQLLDFADRRRWLISSSESICPRRTLPASEDEFMRSLPSRMRTTIRSARRSLEKEHAVEFGMCTDAADLPVLLQTLYQNHASRWRGKGQEGVFVSERKKHFYALLSSRLLALGSLRFYHLKLDDAVVAQQYCFQFGDTVYLLQEGFDFKYSDLNVGNVLRAMVFADLISRGVRHYDFLAGTSRHKRTWSDSEPADLNIQACRRSIVGSAAHYLPRWLSKAKQYVRPSQLGTGP